MFNEKNQTRNTGLVRPGKSSWYSGPAKRTTEKKPLKSIKEILNTPASVRNADIPSDYFD